jgi:CRP/FNR family transcriptional regulator, cyclic AMP receptor protein
MAQRSSQIRPEGPGPLRPWLLTGSGILARLSEADIQALTAICPPRTFRRGDRVYRYGDPADALCVLIHGHVKLSVPARLGGERVVSVCGPEDFFGESFLSGHPQRSAEAICLENETMVCSISRQAFLTLSGEAPTVVLAFMAAFAGRSVDLQGQLDDLSRSAEVRLIRTFLRLTQRLGESKPERGDWAALSLDLKHEDLAGLANVSRVTATEVLSQWRSLGLLTGTRGQYEVNVDGLALREEELEARESS